MSVTDLPKIELHMHLEGAAPPAFVRGLAAEKKIDISGIFDAEGGYKYKDFWDFLKVYEAATSVLKTPQDYYRLTRAVLEESVASNVIYTESFLAPDFCGGGDVSAWRDYLAAIEQAAEEMEQEAGIVIRGVGARGGSSTDRRRRARETREPRRPASMARRYDPGTVCRAIRPRHRRGLRRSRRRRRARKRHRARHYRDVIATLRRH